jgi:hypothetical protein
VVPLEGQVDGQDDVGDARRQEGLDRDRREIQGTQPEERGRAAEATVLGAHVALAVLVHVRLVE